MRIVTVVILIGLLAVTGITSGCSLPTVTLQALQLEREYIDKDKTFMLSLITLYEDSVKAKQKSILDAADEDVKNATIEFFTPQWVLETYQVARLEAAKYDEQLAHVVILRETVATNQVDRNVVLQELEDVIVKSQTWNANTAALVTSLLQTATNRGSLK